MGNVKDYLHHRLSTSLIKAIQRRDTVRVEVFYGSADDSVEFYTQEAQGLQYFGVIKNAITGMDVYVFSGKSGNCFVIGDHDNLAKEVDTVLKLIYSGVHSDKIAIRGPGPGKPAPFVTASVADLDRQLDDFATQLDAANRVKTEIVLVLGPRKQALGMVGIFGTKESETQIELKALDVKINFVKFENDDQRDPGAAKPDLFAAMRMPKGELSHVILAKLFSKFATWNWMLHVVMAGAGGHIAKYVQGVAIEMVHVQKYQKVTEAWLDTSPEKDECSSVALPKEIVMTWTDDIVAAPLPDGYEGLTVLAPLVETDNWLSTRAAAGFRAVDVETYYVFKAMVDSNFEEKNWKVVPGLFVSDVIKEQPLEGGLEAAYDHLRTFLQKFKEVAFPDGG
jgi:hypothetical protein